MAMVVVAQGSSHVEGLIYGYTDWAPQSAFPPLITPPQAPLEHHLIWIPQGSHGCFIELPHKHFILPPVSQSHDHLCP